MASKLFWCLGQFRRFRRPIFSWTDLGRRSARQEFTKRTQGLRPSRENTKRTQGPPNSQRLGERFNIWPIFVPAREMGGMRSSDVMDNIGEMPRHGDVNGRRTICQDRALHSPRRPRDDQRRGSKRVYGISETGLGRSFHFDSSTTAMSSGIHHWLTPQTWYPQVPGCSARLKRGQAGVVESRTARMGRIWCES